MTPPTHTATHILDHLCLQLPSRRVGSPGNRAAADFIAAQFAAAGFEVECPPFDCLDWNQQGASLRAGGQSFEVLVSPFSPGCQVRAQLVSAATLDELEAVQAEGRLLLLHGELTREQLMPKNFPFYCPEEHKSIYRMVEGSHPAALVVATSRNPELAGAIYPFPLFEDGDFDIPSVYMTEAEGARLAACIPCPAALQISAERRPATGSNVIARRQGSGPKRVLLTAHLDAKEGTPGALDNAAGVTTLLLLANLLRSYCGRLGVEMVAVNGEDYYAAPGEIQYLRANVTTLKDIVLNINLDGLGYVEGATAFSFYQCPPELQNLARRAFTAFPGLIKGPAWYQGDHMIFVQNDLPAVAFTSELMAPLWSEIAHTPRDLPELVDAARLEETARALHAFILNLEAFLD